MLKIFLLSVLVRGNLIYGCVLKSSLNENCFQKTELRNKFENEKKEIVEKLTKSEISFKNLEKLMKEKEDKNLDEFKEKVR